MRCMFVIMVKLKMNESFVNITFSPLPLLFFGGRAEVGICMGVGFNVFSHLSLHLALHSRQK